mmetsp:Transcript_10590/g.32549  ORF Transcript_10590/g.32549 Transcript_10590/m.32549 type:complete len:250 (-) Transcript_10590:370-1119(-)
MAQRVGGKREEVHRHGGVVRRVGPRLVEHRAGGERAERPLCVPGVVEQQGHRVVVEAESGQEVGPDLLGSPHHLRRVVVEGDDDGLHKPGQLGLGGRPQDDLVPREEAGHLEPPPHARVDAEPAVLRGEHVVEAVRVVIAGGGIPLLRASDGQASGQARLVAGLAAAVGGIDRGPVRRVRAQEEALRRRRREDESGQLVADELGVRAVHNRAGPEAALRAVRVEQAPGVLAAGVRVEQADEHARLLKRL